MYYTLTYGKSNIMHVSQDQNVSIFMAARVWNDAAAQPHPRMDAITAN
jgi:hypothetical protein